MKSEAPEVTRPTVALVSGDANQLDGLSSLLRKKGLEVRASASAETTLAGMGPDAPELIVSELYRPGIDGWRFCRLLRSPEFVAFNQVPILIIAAVFGGEEADRLAAEFGAIAFPSPVDGKRFSERVRAILSGQHVPNPPRVLIVDGNKTLADTLERAFAADGYDSSVAHSVSEAVDAFARTSFDVAVLDLDLPDGPGDALLEPFASQCPACVCLMMSSDPGPEQALVFMKRGAAAYLRKPFEAKDLVEECARVRRSSALGRAQELLAARTRELHESESIFRTIFERINEAMWIVDPDSGVLIDFNEQAHESLGYTREEFKNLGVADIEAAESPQEVVEHLAQIVLAGNAEFESRHKTKGGDIRDVSVSGRIVTLHGKNFGVATVRDVTEHKRAEEARLAHLEFLQHLDQINRVMIIATDVEQAMTSALETALSIFGCDRAWLLYPCDPDEPTWQIPMEHTRSEYPGASSAGGDYPMTPETAEGFRQLLDSPDPVTEELKPGDAEWDPDDQFSVRSTMCMAIFPKLGKPWGFGLHQCSHARVWTDQEQRLFKEIGHRLADMLGALLYYQGQRESEEKAHVLLNATQEVVMLLNPDGTLVAANRSAAKRYGLTPEELVGKCPFDFAPEEVTENKWELSREFVAGRGPMRFEEEIRGRRFENSAYPILDDDGNLRLVAVFAQDITERRRAEEERLVLERQVLNTQKLESLGALAGGIAHDFNNLLMAILGNADLALDELPPDAPARENLEEIEKTCKRAANLAKQILAYSGRGRSAIEPIGLNRLVEDMAYLIEVSISKRAVLKLSFPTRVPTFDGDAEQIRQIIMNLIANASEAIGEKGGVITLSTGAIDCDREYLDAVDELLRAGQKEPLPAGVYTYFEVADTGCGMDTETIEKIFDPFFTTKSSGPGLGMSAVMGIVRGHQGAIRLSSEIGKGTTIRVLLPAHSVVDNPFVDSEKDPAGKDWLGYGTVLFADDEEPIRTVARQMLWRLGFTVLTAADGCEALALFCEHVNEIRCVLLDLTMPNMDGEQAFRKMRLLNPDVTIILCSGYNEQEATERFADQGLAGFLQKPFNMATLGEILRDVLPEE